MFSCKHGADVWDKTGHETKSEIVIVTVCAIFLVSEPSFFKKKRSNYDAFQAAPVLEWLKIAGINIRTAEE